jgi:hypothetical protein
MEPPASRTPDAIRDEKLKVLRALRPIAGRDAALNTIRGFVEAGLTAMWTLAGVPANDALLATLAYRVVSYWLPLPAGAVAYLLFRRRFGRPPPTPAVAPA